MMNRLQTLLSNSTCAAPSRQGLPDIARQIIHGF
jgi:hypothetical protein